MQGCIRKFTLFYLLLFTLAPQHEAAATTSPLSNPIPNFQTSAPGVYRGGRLNMEGLLYAKALGVKTIVNLESSEEEVDDEIKNGQALGIRVLSYPMTGFFKVEKESVNGALAALADRNLYPILVHCRHGRDRTGLVMALWRVEQQGWTPKQARKEMLDLGFRKVMFALNKYFKKRTGYD